MSEEFYEYRDSDGKLLSRARLPEISEAIEDDKIVVTLTQETWLIK